MALRKEVEPLGLSVSVIKPGLVHSEMSRKVKEGTQRSEDPSAPEASEAAKVYPAIYSPKMEKMWKNYAAKADKPIVVSRAVMHALISPYPYTRYHVANVGGLPAWIYEVVCWLLPDRFK